jgi:hypothetical protein
LLLAACGAEQGQQGGEMIDCRLPGKAGYEHVCSLERASSPEGTILILRRPDGSFHRLLIVKDGRGVIAADGAEQVQVGKSEGSSIEVDIGGGAYRLPAKIRP